MCRGWWATWDEEMERKVFSLKDQGGMTGIRVTQRFPALFGLTVGLRAELKLGKDLSAHPNIGVAFCHFESLAVLFVCLFFK